MKKIILLFAMIIVSLSACQKSESQSEVKTATFNEVCPVSGEPVSAKARTVEHEGKTYGFCCNGCDDKFKKEPAKYIANMSADGKTFVGKAEKMH
ncbi:MAG: YHS domain-containing protein [Chlorobiales bacterium]